MRALAGWLAIGGALAYVATIALAGAATPGYSHACQLISELGEAGAPSAALMAGMLVSVGVIVVLLAWQLLALSRLGGTLVATIGAGLILGGVFQCDPGCAPRSFAGWAHILTSIPATLSALAGPFVFARAMRRDPRWQPYASGSALLGWVSIVAISTAALVFPAFELRGLGQRLATLVQLAWMTWMAVALLRVRA